MTAANLAVKKRVAQHITIPMYEKGRSFVMAGALVKAYEGHRFVYLHLLCQGLECIGKALLLAHDYGKYKPVLGTSFRHDLVDLVAEVSRATGTEMFSELASSEVRTLNHFYKNHILRYGDPADFRKEARELAADHLHEELVGGLTEWNLLFEALESDV